MTDHAQIRESEHELSRDPGSAREHGKEADAASLPTDYLRTPAPSLRHTGSLLRHTGSLPNKTHRLPTKTHRLLTMRTPAPLLRGHGSLRLVGARLHVHSSFHLESIKTTIFSAY